MFGGQDWNRLNYDPTIEGGLTAAQIVTGALGGAIISQFVTPPRSGHTRGGRKYQPMENPNAPKKRRISTGPSHSSITSGGNSGDSGPPNMSSRVQAGMSKNPNDGEEVAVIPPPAKIAKIAPNYFTLDLPYFETFEITRPPGSTSLTYYRVTLNSIYNVTGESSTHVPKGRAAMEGLFKYYRVLKSVARVKWLNIAQAPTENLILADSTLVGYQLTDDSADVFTNYYGIIEGKHSKTDILMSNAFTGVAGKTAEHEFNYSPETWDYHINGDAEEERWTLMGSTPPNVHAIMFGSGPINHSQGTSVKGYLYLKYTVQFREHLHDRNEETAGAAE